jgi:hypothetical protein
MSFRERWREHKSTAAYALIVATLCVIVQVIFPSEEEKDAFRDVYVQPPMIGHWITSEGEIRQMHEEVSLIIEYLEDLRFRRWKTERLTGRQAYEIYTRLVEIDRSLPPLEVRKTYTGRGPLGSMYVTQIPHQEVSQDASIRLHDLRVRITSVTADPVMTLESQSDSYIELEVYRDLLISKGTESVALKAMVKTDYHFPAFMAWFLVAYAQAVLISLGFFVARAWFMDVSVFKLLEKPGWIIAFPAGIFLHPDDQPWNLVKSMGRQVAWAIAAFFSVMVPSGAYAQAKRDEGMKKRPEQTLLLVPSVVATSGGPPDQLGFWAQLQLPDNGWAGELSLSATPTADKTFIEGGLSRFLKTGKFATMVTLYADQASDGYKKLAAGLQFYWPIHERFFWAIPYFRYGVARAPDGLAVGSFEVQANPFWTPGPKRLAIAPDVYVAREKNSNFWHVGGGVEIFDKDVKDSWGLAVLRTSAGEWKARIRYILTLKSEALAVP